MSKYDELKNKVYTSNMDLPRYGLVLFTFGNASMVDREEGVFGIKPSGVDYEKLRPVDIVIVDLEGKTVEGVMKPSSDTNTHLVLYNNFKNIGGIVHTHATHSVAWAQAAKSVPLLGTTHADHLHVDIPCTYFMSDEMIKGDYEIETGNQIIQTLQDLNPDEIEMVLVAGHGPFTWGKTIEKAVYNSVVLEELARMALYTQQINPQVPRLPDSLVQKHYERKHGPNAYYGQK
jgi:L-ribulose-5-phosphate 4-epimerase